MRRRGRPWPGGGLETEFESGSHRVFRAAPPLLPLQRLVSIPNDYYQAAKIDGASAWSVFRYIQLPKLRRVLTIAILLRFMDSFMIYTEVIVLTGGGPGNSTTFLSIDLVKTALGQFDLGPAAAMSLIYFLIILLFSWLFYTLMTRNEAQ